MSLTSYALKLAEATGHPMADHSRAVAELASDVALELELDGHVRQEIEIAALLHDIGKVALMDEILYRSDGLTQDELVLIRNHPVRGQAMLERAGEHFGPIGRIVRSCHERWDGTGYPDGLAGESIPLAARVIFCCTAYESMTSNRPYSKPMSHTMAIRELWAFSGSQFDPGVVPALVRAASRRSATAAAADAATDARADVVDFARAGAGGAGGNLG